MALWASMTIAEMVLMSSSPTIQKYDGLSIAGPAELYVYGDILPKKPAQFVLSQFP